MGKTMRTAEQVELDAKRQKLGEEAGTEAGDAATAADAADPGAPEAEDEYGYLDEELAINEDDIAAQAEAEQAIAALEVLQRQLMEVWGADPFAGVHGHALLYGSLLCPRPLNVSGR